MSARQAATRIRLVHHDEAPGLLDALVDRLLVERRGRSGVDDLALDAVRGELGGGLLGHADHAADGDDGDVAALTHDVRLAERDRVQLLGHVALDSVHDLVLEVDHGIVVADRATSRPFAS